MDRESHWNRVYETKPADTVSWYQRIPERSVSYIRKFAEPSQTVIDVGAGASLLVDGLLDIGYENLIVLDVSAVGLEVAKARLSSRSGLVRWIVADVTKKPTLPQADLWHDRAVLHFLTEAEEQNAYRELVTDVVNPSGHLVLATFAPDGPERCSGLPVQRHDGVSLTKLLGAEFELLHEDRESHVTPAGNEQRFCWTVFRRR